MKREVEIKFRVEAVRSLTRALRGAGFRLKTKRTHEMNTLYDLPSQRLRRRGELLRDLERRCAVPERHTDQHT